MLDFSSLTRDWICAPGIGSEESYPLDHQGRPQNWFEKNPVCQAMLSIVGTE